MSETAKALFKDSLYQVLDNKVFRIMTVLVAVLILPTFVIAAKRDSLVILYGWKEIPYADGFSSFLGQAGSGGEFHVELIKLVQLVLVDHLAGTYGLIFAVAATAFFVPRLVEKGAADTVFSKPVSRSALLLSRYVAGLLFVGLLVSVMVTGMYLGLGLNSSYWDTGFLWSIPLMVYKYAVLHAVSLLVAVITRSSVAAILTTLMFFAFNGCVHIAWQQKELSREQSALQVQAGEEEEAESESSSLIRTLVVILDTLHYTLPKTGDAALISQKLRTAIADRNVAFEDDVSGLQIRTAPEGFERQTVVQPPVIGLWTRAEGIGRITLSRWTYAELKRKDALKALDQRLEGQGIAVEKDREHVMAVSEAHVRRWREPRGSATVARKDVWINGASFLFAIEYELPENWAEDAELVQAIDSFQASLDQPESSLARPDKIQEHRASWTGELKYNLSFSVLSTLAFILVTLGLACWKLSRIDF